MRAQLGRDAAGFWCAYVEVSEAHRPDSTATGTVRVRHTLPVPFTASRAEAEKAFRRFMSQESRKRHERR